MLSVTMLALAGQLLGAAMPLASGTDVEHGRPSATSAEQSGDQSGDQAQPPVTFDPTRFDSLTALSLRSFLDSAAEQGLPLGPLINRALEGAARRVSGARIMQVVRAHAAAMAEARAILGPTTPVADLDAAATALRAGVDEKALSAIRTSRPVGSVVIPLMVLTDIVQRGVPIIAARDAVTTIARMPSSDDALKGLRAAVAKNSVRGPGMAVDALNRYLRGTVSGGNPPSAPATTDRKPIRPPSP